MDSNSTEREYLLKSGNLTWEHVEVFEDQFGSVKLNDGCENMKDHPSSADTGAENKVKTSGSLHRAKIENFSEKNLNRNVKEEDFGGTHVYIKPSVVLSSVGVVLSNAVDIDEQNIDYEDRSEVFSQTLVPPQSMFSSNDRNNISALYNCSIYQKQFTGNSFLTHHLRSHTGEKPFSCSQCEKTFAQKGNLKRHQLVHSGTKEYSCDICYKAFTQKGHLKTHLLIHSGKKEYSCDICYKSFTQKGNLNSHLLVHSGTKKYSCDICYKTFTHHHNLKTHQRVHTGDKPYECKECGATFAHSQSSKRHMHTHN